MLSTANQSPLTHCATAVSSLSQLSSSSASTSSSSLSTTAPSTQTLAEASPTRPSSSAIPHQSSSQLPPSSPTPKSPRTSLSSSSALRPSTPALFPSNSPSSFTHVLSAVFLFVAYSLSSLFLVLLCLLSPTYHPWRSLVSSQRRGSGSFSPAKKSKSRLLSSSSSSSSLSSVSLYPSSSHGRSFHSALLLTTLLMLTMSPSFLAAAPVKHSLTNVSKDLSDYQDTEFQFKTSATASSPSYPTLKLATPIEDTMQQDGPRDVHNLDPNWSKAQGRILYLRAMNNQYLQVHNGTVSGTEEYQPVLGILKIFYHNDNLVMMHYLTKKYICMNSNYDLYLLNSPDNRDCHMQQHTFNESHGAYKNYYVFKRHTKDGHSRYLGIDCKAVSWVAKPENSHAVRFFEDNQISKSDLKRIDAYVKKRRERGEWLKPGGSKCKSAAEIKEEAKREREMELVEKERMRQMKIKERKKMKKLRAKEREKRKRKKKKQRARKQRWCWALPRMMKNPDKHRQECRKKFSAECGDRYGIGSTVASPKLISGKTSPSTTRSNRTRSGRSDCPCNALDKMLDNYERAKRTCLRDKLNLFVNKRLQNVDSRSPASPDKYAISAAVKLFQPGFSGIARRMRNLRAKKRDKKRKKKQRSRNRRKGIKINPVLNSYVHELISNSTVPQPAGGTPARKSSAISKEFSEAIESLLHTHRRRQRKGRRRKQRQQRRSRATENQQQQGAAGPDKAP